MNKKAEMQKLYESQKKFGCVVCRKFNIPKQSWTQNYIEIHHLRKGMGMGQRNIKCIPLCIHHHRENCYGYHGMGRKAFEKQYCSEQELLEYWENTIGMCVNWRFWDK